MQEEIWKPAPGFEGLYEVSNYGNVKSLNYRRSGKERIIDFYPGTNGYRQRTLYKDGKAINMKLHRLVALAFIPNPDNLPQINHKDEDKTNNCVDNLEWCDAKYNINYGTGMDRRTEARMIEKPTYKGVRDVEKFKQYLKDNKIKQKLYNGEIYIKNRKSHD